MIGKTLTSRIVLLVLAVILTLLLWGYVGTEVKAGLVFLVVLRVVFLLPMLAQKETNDDTNSITNNDENQ